MVIIRILKILETRFSLMELRTFMVKFVIMVNTHDLDLSYVYILPHCHSSRLGLEKT